MREIEPEIEPEFEFETAEELNLGPVQQRSSGTVDPKACKCDWPQLALGHGDVGPYYHQTVYCSKCGYRFFDFIEPREDNGSE